MEIKEGSTKNAKLKSTKYYLPEQQKKFLGHVNMVRRPNLGSIGRQGQIKKKKKSFPNSLSRNPLNLDKKGKILKEEPIRAAETFY